MPSSCKELRAALAACLQESDCVMVHRNTALDCMRPALVETLPLACQQLKRGFGECRRGMIDMRKRFRGNVPVQYEALEAARHGENYQLYAGRPASASSGPGGARITDGNEPEKLDWREVENQRYREETARKAAAEAAQQKQQQQQEPPTSASGAKTDES